MYGNLLFLLRYMLLILLPVMLLGFDRWATMTARWRAALLGLMLAAVLVFGATASNFMLSNVAQPPEWDFQVFWLSSRLANQGVNFYDPEQLQHLAAGLHPTEEFTREFLQVGMSYPPTTMLLFLPLGWFDIRTALSLWYLGNGAVLMLAMGLLWSIFLRQSGWRGLVLTAALTMMLRGTLSTILYAQTNFIALLMLLLYWRDRERPRGGMWLAAGILAKPLLACFLLFVLLRRHWHGMISALMTLAGISVVAIILFGPATCASYFTSSSLARLPTGIYTETMNQSLLSTILRLTHYDFRGGSPVTQPLFITLALVLTGISGWLVYRLAARDAEWALALTVCLGLLLYPGTLEHYSVLLIAPLLLMWARRQALAGGVWAAVAFITVEYALISYPEGRLVFVAIALSWLTMAACSAWAITQPPVHADGVRIHAARG